MMRCKIITVLGILCVLLSCLLPFSSLESIESTKSRGTTALLVVSTTPENVEVDVELDTEITITFSMAINDSIFIQGFQISPLISGIFSWSNNNKTVTFTLDINLTEEQKYVVTLNKNYIQSQDEDYKLEFDYSWSFTTVKLPPEPFPLILGPFLTEDDKVVRDAKVTITVNSLEYSGLTDNDGFINFEFPEQPPSGEYEISVLKEGYEGFKYFLEIEVNGIYNSIPPGQLKEEEEPPSFIPGFETIVLLTGLVLLLIYTRKRK